MCAEDFGLWRSLPRAVVPNAAVPNPPLPMTKTILITGSSRGIGRATALALVAQGHRVIAASRSGATVPGCQPLALDLTLPESMTQAVSSLRAQGEVIDVLINNAGGLVNRPYNMLTREDFMTMAQVNWIGPALWNQSLESLFAPGAHIVNISSMGGFQGASKYPGLAAYASSKAALVGLTECLQAEWGDRGWTFNALCLGAVQTEMLAEAFPGYVAPTTPETMGNYLAHFGLTGHETYAGAALPVTKSNP